MVTKTQAALGGSVVVGVGAVAAGTSLSGDNYNLEMANTPSYDFTVLAWETDYDSSYDTDTVGKKYAWYLTGIYGIDYKDEKLELDLKNNEKWWEWSFNRWKIDTYRDKKNQEGDFANVTSSYVTKDSTDNKALNKVCENIYKKKASDWNDEVNLLRYCSPLGEKPVLISDSKFLGPKATNSAARFNSGTYGDTKKDTLVSADDIDNDANKMFFYLKSNEFFGKVDGDGIGKDLSDSNKYFYKLYEGRSTDTDRKTNIYDSCWSVYRFSTSSGNVEDEDLDRYCSWNIK